MSEWKTIPDFRSYGCHEDDSDGVKVRRKKAVRGHVLGMQSNRGNVGGNLITPREDRFRIKKVPYGQVFSLEANNLYNATWKGEELVPRTNGGRV